MLKYKDLYDYIVGVLYSLKKDKKTGYYSLREIVENLEQPSTPSEIFEIGKYLEAEGYVKADFRVGDVFIEITPQGIVYFEDKSAEFITKFEEFVKQKNNQEKVDKVASKLSAESIQKSKKLVLEKIETIIKHLESAKEINHPDVLIDAKILKLEIEKENPDNEVVTIKIMNLESFAGLKQESNELKEYFPKIGNRHY